MTSREGEEGTKESRDDCEADHEGKEPVRRKLPQRKAKLPQMVRRMASGDALGACKVFEHGKSTGTEKVKETSISPKVDARVKLPRGFPRHLKFDPGVNCRRDSCLFDLLCPSTLSDLKHWP